MPWRESLAPTSGGCTDNLSQGIMAEVGGFHGKHEQAGIRVLPGLRYFLCIYTGCHKPRADPEHST